MTALPHGPLAYAGILTAATVEGEVTYIAASALVAQGVLNPIGVIVAGAIGAAIGDQFYFYLLRRRLARWVGRWPSIERRAAALLQHVRRHQAAMVLLIRFAPGLRIAIAAACAYANVDAVLFSALDFVSALLWATSLLGFMVWVGPVSLAAIGINGWSAVALTGVLLFIVFRLAGWIERRYVTGP